MNDELRVSFDGIDLKAGAATFVAVIDAKNHGCDVYFDDATRQITEIIDWEDGNGLLAHGCSEHAVRERAKLAIMEAVA